MSSIVVVGSPSAGFRPLARVAGLMTLLLIEMMALMLRFDGGTLAGERRWWAGLVAGSHHLPALAIAAAVATLLFGGTRLRDDLRQLAEQLPRSRRSWPFLLTHLAAFAGFARLTAFVLEGGLKSSPCPEVCLIGWVALGAAVVTFWGAALLPIGLWLSLVRRTSGALTAGIAVGLAAWGAGLLADGLWAPLGRSTLAVVQSLLGLIVSDAVCRPAESIVGTSTFAVTIAPECSGYEGIGLIWVFLAVYFWACRRTLRFPRAYLLLPVGTALMWAANALRITALVAVGAWFSPDVALGGFHSQAGWLAFNAIGLGLVAVTRRMRFFHAADSITESDAGSNPTAAYLAPMLAIVLTAMLTGAFTHGFDWSYPLRVLAAAGILIYFRRAYAEVRRTWSWTALAIGAGVFVVWMALEPVASGTSVGDALSGALAGRGRGWALAWLAFRVVGSTVTVPIAEELAFRGFLTRRLISADFLGVPAGRFTWVSFLISSILFGGLHGRWLAGTLAGMAYALAVYRRGEVADAVLAHATTNALIAAYVIGTGTWSLWA